MAEDPIIAEIRAHRRQVEAACDHDWEKLFAYYRKVQDQARQKVVSGAPKRLKEQRKTG